SRLFRNVLSLRFRLNIDHLCYRPWLYYRAEIEDAGRVRPIAHRELAGDLIDNDELPFAPVVGEGFALVQIHDENSGDFAREAEKRLHAIVKHRVGFGGDMTLVGVV